MSSFMWGSIFLNLLSFFIFKSNCLAFVPFPSFEEGEIVKVVDSQYFSEKLSKMEIPDISATNAVVLDLNKDIFIFEKDSEEVKPIASISKLMAVLVMMENFKLDLDEYYIIKGSDHRPGGRNHVFRGEEVKRQDLLALTLIASDNSALISLISSLNLEEKDLVELMNQKAKDLGLENTRFEDATGLDVRNVSTAKELATLLKESFSIPEIVDLIKKPQYSFYTKQGVLKTAYSTNELLNNFTNQLDLEIIGAKTGYNDLSGYCLGSKFSINQSEFISIVLNASSLKARFNDTRNIAQAVYNYYN
ncbi:MAG: D-alanyl-D-alanine carboxypeptidase family protein [Patescibacteria group bacterium]|jgi:D-alanyl-D-alanine carboxypeptidase